MKTFFQILSDAVAYFAVNGYSKSQQDYWTRLLRDSLRSYLPTERDIKKKADKYLTAIYGRTHKKLAHAVAKQVVKENTNEPVSRFTIQNMKGLERELEKSVGKSLSLIGNNRDLMIQHMVNKFQGWVSSVPVQIEKGKPATKDVSVGKDVKDSIKKLVKDDRYKVDRVLIDQGHKLVSNINDTFASNNGAIAAKWAIAHTKEGIGGRPYEHRPEHVAREGKIFLLRDSWARQKGLIKPVNGYTDDIEQPAELPFCRCSYTYIYSISALPDEFLTAKAKKMLATKK